MTTQGFGGEFGLIGQGRPQRLGQRGRGHPRHRKGRTDMHTNQSPAPDGLVGTHPGHHGGQAGPQSGGHRPGAAVMDRRPARQEHRVVIDTCYSRIRLGSMSAPDMKPLQPPATSSRTSSARAVSVSAVASASGSPGSMLPNPAYTGAGRRDPRQQLGGRLVADAGALRRGQIPGNR